MEDEFVAIEAIKTILITYVVVMTQEGRGIDKKVFFVRTGGGWC